MCFHFHVRQEGKPRPVGDEERTAVLEMRETHPLCALTLEKLLKEKKCYISHNRIHKILLEESLAKPEPKKQKRRKPWIVMSVKHSNSLWHVDWFERNNEQIITIEDDASKFIVSVEVFKNATAANAKLVLERAIRGHGCPK